MRAQLPICSTSHAFRLFSRQIKRLESPDALLKSAIAIAVHHVPDINPADVEATLNSYVTTIQSRVRGPQPQALLAHMHQYLFEELGFNGETDDYYNPVNSYLPVVLETKRGLPITLTLIYKIIGERLGLRVWGVPLPGHFLAGVQINGSTMLVDPFARGRVVSVDEAQERMEELFGHEIEWNEQMLAPASNRHWLTRMLQNLLNIFGTLGRYNDVGAMLEMEMLLWPDQNRLQRDLALVLARLGLSQPASAWLNQYLKNNPDDPQQQDLKQLLSVLVA